MSKEVVNVKRNVDLSQAIHYLESVVASLKEGTVCFRHGAEFVTLKPEDRVEFEMEGLRKGQKERMRLELSWRHPPLTVPEPAEDFAISSNEPEPADAPHGV